MRKNYPILVVVGLLGAVAVWQWWNIRQLRENRLQSARGHLVSGNQSPASPPQPALGAEVKRLTLDVSKLREDNATLARRIENLKTETPPVLPAVSIAENESKKAEFKAEMIAQMNLVKGALMAMAIHGNKTGKLPDTFDQAGEFMEERDRTNASLQYYEIVYTGKLESIAAPENTIIVRQKETGLTPDGKYFRAYGFADGHVEIHSEVTDSFTEWERKRWPPEPK